MEEQGARLVPPRRTSGGAIPEGTASPVPDEDAPTAVEATDEPSSGPDEPGTRTGGSRSRLLPVAGEIVVALLVPLVLTGAARFISVDPLRRVGQVSGLAAVQLGALAIMGVLLVGLALGQRLRRPQLALRLVCGGFAGVFSGVVAAGTVVALRGSAWPLGGQGGDAGVLQMWADHLLDGQAVDRAYPPAYLYLVAGWAKVFSDGLTGPALQGVEILVTALVTPLAYLAWRMLLSPLWALAIGVLASAPLVNPYKPYTAVVLAVLIPTVAKLFQVLQRAAELDRGQAARVAAGLGVLLGFLFLTYSGWFVWSFPGVGAVAVVLLVRLWRQSGREALRTGLLVVGVAAASFGAIAGWYAINLLRSTSTVDRYCYFDTYTEPTYFAMWRDDLPGLDAGSTWPPPGELAGVGLFSIVLLVGLATALCLGLGRPAVLAAAGATASALVLRYWLAAHMESDQAVQLYPRTTQQILYCLLVLTGLAVLLIVERGRTWAAARFPLANGASPAAHPGPVGWRTALGVLCGLGLLFGMAGSATAMRYMPDTTESSSGRLAWMAHSLRNPDGQCSANAPGGTCENYDTDLENLISEESTNELVCFTYMGFPTNP